MIALLLAALCGAGVFLLYTHVAFGWQGIGLGLGHRATLGKRTVGASVRDWLVQAGLADVRPAQFAAVIVLLAATGALCGFAMFGGIVPGAALALFAGSAPVALYRNRRARRLETAQEAWPTIIEEIRMQATSLGRSLPQALFDAGARAPEELRPAFVAANREWLLTTDFARTLDVLKANLADPTADVACETLLIAHEIGGTDLPKRLQALAEDRLTDVMGRKDARSKQAGVRFARRFVLIVPAGMAFAGSLIGTGRSAYATPLGQLIVAIALGFLIVCWLWAGRFLRLPRDERVFRTGDAEAVR